MNFLTFCYLLVVNFSAYPQPHSFMRLSFSLFFNMQSMHMRWSHLRTTQSVTGEHFIVKHIIQTAKNWNKIKTFLLKAFSKSHQYSMFIVYLLHLASILTFLLVAGSIPCSSYVTTILTKFWYAQKFILCCIDRWNDKRETLPGF